MSEDVRSFYDELADDYHEIFADWDASVRRQGTVLEKLLGGPSGPILDLSAGMGTQAIALALRGHAVVARDLSPRMVERGRREAARLGATLSFEVADMRERREDDTGRFAVVIAFDNALPHLDEVGLRDALRNASAALKPGGRFLASIRDYDGLAAERPRLEPARLHGTPPHRRMVLQTWDWAPDGRSYTLDHLLLNEEDGGWRCRSRRTKYRALLRAELSTAAEAEGLTGGRWLMPDESGFYQPIFEATRPAPR